MKSIIKFIICFCFLQIFSFSAHAATSVPSCLASMGALNYNTTTNAYSCNPVLSGLVVDPRSPQFGSNTCTGYYGIATSALGVGGSGYNVGDKFTIAVAIPGSNVATGHVTAVSSGVVTSYTIDTAGGAYNMRTGNTLATTAITGSGSGLTITISTASTGGNDDTAAIYAAEIYAATIGAKVLAPGGCWINNLLTPINTTIEGSALAPSYGYDTSNVPNWFIWGSPTFGINTTGSANVSLVGFGVTGIASSGAFNSTACIGGTSMGGAFFGSRNFAINMSGHYCNVGLGLPFGLSGSFILWTSLNSDWGANNVAGEHGSFSDFVSIDDTIASTNTGIWITSQGGAFATIIRPRLEYLNNYGIELDAGGSQTQISDITTDRTMKCAVYLNGAVQVTQTGGALRGSGMIGTLTVTGAAAENNGSGLIQLTVSGFGNNPNGGATATSGLSTGDTVNISGVTGTTEANGTWVLTVIDGSHIDLQSSTFTHAYISGGLGGVNGKAAYVCMNGATDYHASNVGFYGDSAGQNVSAAYVLDTTGSSNISVEGGSAPLGNSNLGAYRVSIGNYRGGTPTNTRINIPANTPFINDNNSYAVDSSGNWSLLKNTVLGNPNATTQTSVEGNGQSLLFLFGENANGASLSLDAANGGHNMSLIESGMNNTPGWLNFFDATEGQTPFAIFGGTSSTAGSVFSATSSSVLGFVSSNQFAAGGIDTSISRDSAGVFDFGTGAQGSKAGTINAAVINQNGNQVLNSGQAISVLSANVTGSTAPANGIYLPSANTVALSTNSNKQLQINSTGAAQLGTTSEGSSITVFSNSTQPIVTFDTNTSGGGIFMQSTTAHNWSLIPSGSANGSGYFLFFDNTEGSTPLALWGGSSSSAGQLIEASSGAVIGFSNTATTGAAGMDIGLSRDNIGVADLGNGTQGNKSGILNLATLNASATIKTGGYTVSTLPAGTAGMRSYVTDQTTSCPAAGAALTGSGAITCPVFFNGSSWVGD